MLASTTTAMVIRVMAGPARFAMPIIMTRHCMQSYALRVIQSCHRRGAHAMGGMAAQIPIKGDAQANETALTKVREDKIR